MLAITCERLADGTIGGKTTNFKRRFRADDEWERYRQLTLLVLDTLYLQNHRPPRAYFDMHKEELRQDILNGLHQLVA